MHPASMFFHLKPAETRTSILPGNKETAGTRRDAQGPTISIFLGTRVHPGPIFFLGPGPTPHLGSKKFNTQQRDMHGLFDHEPVFSIVVQIIFQTGVGNCLWHGSPLSAEQTQDCVDSSHRATVGTMDSYRSRNVTQLEDCRRQEPVETVATREAAGVLARGGGRGRGWGLAPSWCNCRIVPEKEIVLK